MRDIPARIAALEVKVERLEEDRKEMDGIVKSLQKILWAGIGVVAVVQVAIEFVFRLFGK